jgi:hypothetical protein
MAVRRKKRTVTRSKKLMAKIKRDGVFKGTGDWAGSQIGGSAGNVVKKMVPALMLLTVVSAVTPPLGSAIANSLSTIPIVSPLANTSVSYGQQLRARFGR